jgi:hypothetical protein
MRMKIVKFRGVARDPYLRLDPSRFLRQASTERPVHRLLSAEGGEKPDCVDICERLAERLLETGFTRKDLGLDRDEADHSKILEAMEKCALVRTEPDFTKTERDERILWCVLEEDAQALAEEILGRKLTLEELQRAKKSLGGEWKAGGPPSKNP